MITDELRDQAARLRAELAEVEKTQHQTEQARRHAERAEEDRRSKALAYREEAGALIQDLSRLLAEAHEVNERLLRVCLDAQNEGCFIGWFEWPALRHKLGMENSYASWLRRVAKFDPACPSELAETRSNARLA